MFFKVVLPQFIQGSLYYQPKQCTINGKILKCTIHLHCLMPPKIGDNLMIPVIPGLAPSLQVLHCKSMATLLGWDHGTLTGLSSSLFQASKGCKTKGFPGKKGKTFQKSAILYVKSAFLGGAFFRMLKCCFKKKWNPLLRWSFAWVVSWDIDRICLDGRSQH